MYRAWLLERICQSQLPGFRTRGQTDLSGLKRPEMVSQVVVADFRRRQGRCIDEDVSSSVANEGRLDLLNDRLLVCLACRVVLNCPSLAMQSRAACPVLGPFVPFVRAVAVTGGRLGTRPRSRPTEANIARRIRVKALGLALLDLRRLAERRVDEGRSERPVCLQRSGRYANGTGLDGEARPCRCSAAKGRVVCCMVRVVRVEGRPWASWWPILGREASRTWA